MTRTAREDAIHFGTKCTDVNCIAVGTLVAATIHAETIHRRCKKWVSGFRGVAPQRGGGGGALET